jgi:hypothetical protein
MNKTARWLRRLACAQQGADDHHSMRELQEAIPGEWCIIMMHILGNCRIRIGSQNALLVLEIVHRQRPTPQESGFLLFESRWHDLVYSSVRLDDRIVSIHFQGVG